MNIRKPLVAGLAVASLLLSSLSVYAQDAAAPAPAAPAAAPAAPADGAAAPAAGAAAPAAGATDQTADANAGDPTKNWLKVCDPIADGKRACIMRQVVLANGQFLGSFLLRDDPGQTSRLLAIAAVPLGVLLPFGLTWQIDGGKPVRVPYMLCDPTSCATQLVINEAYVAALKKGSTLKLVAKNRQNQDLSIEINLGGFTTIYDGDAALTFDEFRKESTGSTALEQVLQDRAEQLRKQLDGTAPAAAPAADGTAAPAAPAADAPATPAAPTK